MPRAGEKRALRQRTELRFAGIDQSPRFGLVQVADLRSARFAEGLYPTPGLISRGMSLPEREVERGLEHVQDALGGRPTLPHGIGILDIDVADVLPFRCLAGPETGGRLGECGMPLPNHGRRQVSDFVCSELRPDEGVGADFEPIKRLAAAALVVDDVVVQAAVDRGWAGSRLDIERSEPVSRLGLRLRIIQDALAIGIECASAGPGVVSRRPLLSISLASQTLPVGPLRSPRAKPRAIGTQYPDFLAGSLACAGTGVELGIADSASHRASQFPKNIYADKGGHARTDRRTGRRSAAATAPVAPT
jgi:hypothetical protein